MDSLFFRVEHDLLKSDSFKQLGGSAVKVYLVIGLYSDFNTGWAYPSIRTIAQQAGLSRQTVLTAINDLVTSGVMATHKSRGRATAYQILREAPARPSRKSTSEQQKTPKTGPKTLDVPPKTGPKTLDVPPKTGPKVGQALAQFLQESGPIFGPEQTERTRDETSSIPIPGTAFRLSSDGRLQVAVDLQGLLTDQGIPQRLAEKLASQKDPEAVAKVLLNAMYLESQGKLQNGPGYIRAGIEDGYDLLPQVADRLESRRKELAARIQFVERMKEKDRATQSQAAEEEAITIVLQQLATEEVNDLIQRAISELPAPLVRRNPTLTNPFIRAKVYELAAGEPD